jgi:hypothetical protein
VILHAFHQCLAALLMLLALGSIQIFRRIGPSTVAQESPRHHVAVVVERHFASELAD